MNTTIKNYQLPHCFKIHLVRNRAVCLHKPFSSSPTWLPPPPKDYLPPDQFALMSSNDFTVEDFQLFGGLQAIIAKGINNDRAVLTQEELFNPKHRLEATNMTVFQSVVDDLRSACVSAASETVTQMEQESSEGYSVSFDHRTVLRDAKGSEGAALSGEVDDISPSDIGDGSETPYLTRRFVDHKLKVAMQRDMVSHSTEKEGHIFWLDWSRVDHTWYDQIPMPINYFNDVSNIP